VPRGGTAEKNSQFYLSFSKFLASSSLSGRFCLRLYRVVYSLVLAVVFELDLEHVAEGLGHIFPQFGDQLFFSHSDRFA
jgi:hypothetical protein